MTRPGQTGSLFTRGRGWGKRGERERNGRQEAVFLDWGKRNQHLKQKLWLILTVLETAFLRLKTAFLRDIPFMIGDCLSATTKRSAIKNSIFEKHFVFLCDKRQTLCGYKRYPIKSSLPEKRKKKKKRGSFYAFLLQMVSAWLEPVFQRLETILLRLKRSLCDKKTFLRLETGASLRLKTAFLRLESACARLETVKRLDSSVVRNSVSEIKKCSFVFVFSS